MRPPDYRPAACCGNCHFHGFGTRCSRHGWPVDMLSVCADFATVTEVEGDEVRPWGGPD